MKRMTTEVFMEKAMAVHGSRYDYSLSVLVNTKTKVQIGCSKHGAFEQTPANHLQGMGCIRCGFENAGQYHKKDSESFIAEAKAIHGDRYDYSQVQYKGARERVIIVCPKHGPFQQVAFVHLRGKSGAGCERCSYEERAARARLTFDEFLTRAKAFHKDFYDYSLVEKDFVDLAGNVIIICPTHGPFSQTPAGHFTRGCPTCGTIRAAASLRKSTELFVQDARKIHGDLYDYSEADYTGAFSDVRIICPLDGVFIQTPSSHLAGVGCPRCSRRKQGAPRNLTRALRGEFDAAKEAFVYIVVFRLPCADTALYKIGSGTGSRMKTVINDIKRVGGYDLSISHIPFASTGEAIVFEHLAHEQVRADQFIVPVKFKFHGHSEVFIRPPTLESLADDSTLKMFRSGKRWDPRE